MRRHVVLVVTLSVALAAASLQAAAADDPPRFGQCLKPGADAETYGPTDINAQSANQRLAVGLNRAATITVLRWPRPSYYDQIKYHTTDRRQPRLGARVNEGAFLGLAVGGRTTWLRDWPSQQRYVDDRSDAVATTYRRDDLGLTVTVTDVVARDADVLARRVEVRRDARSPVRRAGLVAFENLNLVVSRNPQLPTQDWCQEEQNTDSAVYDRGADAVVHWKSGLDLAGREQVSVAVATGIAPGSDEHQVGTDAHEPSAGPGPTDAYDDAADGRLSGSDGYSGQTTGALLRRLDLGGGGAVATVLFAGAPTPAAATGLIRSFRARPFDALLRDKRAWYDSLVGRAPMPASSDPAVLALAHRALVSLAGVYDPRSGAVVASIATQSPYAEDWPRDGAFFDHALDLIGRHDWVQTRLRFYAAVQQRPDRPDPFAPLAPPGNWAMNYYADGVPGGPIPWEIDETAYVLWSDWDHFSATGDRATLGAVWPSIRLAADFLTTCRDATTGLQCPANEDDVPVPSQTIVGAGTVWLGLDRAARAAAVLGHAAERDRWLARRDELARAIDARLWDERAGAWGGGDAVTAWPVCFRPFGDPRMRRHLEAVWRRVEPDFRAPAPGAPTAGSYETKALLALARAWRDDPARVALVRRGLTWVARVWATPDTHVMGEAWRVIDGRVVTTTSMPHLWEQVLFYLGAVEAWPSPGAPDTAACPPGVPG